MFNNELWQKPTAAGATDFYSYQIANSCRFNRADGSYLSRTIQSGGNLRKWTFSCWFKLTASAGFSGNQYYLMTEKSGSPYDTMIFDVDSDNLFYYQVDGKYLKPNNALRDTSAWGHLVIVYDSDNGTADDRRIVYFNGTRLGVNSSQALSQNVDSGFNSNTVHYIGARQDNNASYYGDFYLADVIWSDGYAYAPTQFGEEKNGCWIAKEFSGSYGTTGYHLKFESSSDLGNDSSGNNNDWTVNNISTHDQMLDSPTFNSSSNGGNFCTLNPLTDAVNMTLSEGNLTWTTSTNNRSINCNFKLPAGTGQKWYWEHRMASWGGSESDDVYIGINILQPDWDSSNTRGGGNTGNSYGAQGYKNALGTDTSSYGDQIDTGDVWGVAVDLENNTIQFYKEGSAQGAAWSISGTTEWYPWVGSGGGSSSASGTFNFGQNGTFNGTETAGGNPDANGYGNFFSNVPTGFKALCAANLAVAEEVDPAKTDDDYPQKLFQALTYTGTGSSGSITTRFQPDLIWIKNRGTTKRNYNVDSTRGINSTSPYLHSDQNVSEGTGNTTGISAAGSTSFSFGGGLDYVNASSNTYVAWNWRANGGTTSSGSGDLTSTYQVDPSGCFSIVSYTANGTNNQTFSHGLSAKPDFIIVKSRSQTSNWAVYTSSTGATKYLKLNDVNAQTDSEYYWNDTEPTSSVVTVGNNTDVNYGSGQTYIVYCFANCEGYIKAGSYEGNGNVNGTFVHTGFKPAFVLIKDADDNQDPWALYDNIRPGYNVTEESLHPNTDAAESDSTSYSIDLLSNGFKLRTTFGGQNATHTYIYLAMAHNPFKYATAR